MVYCRVTLDGGPLRSVRLASVNIEFRMSPADFISYTRQSVVWLRNHSRGTRISRYSS
jgi:hypothetical protein